MPFIMTYRATNRTEQHRFSPLFSIARGFARPALEITAAPVPEAAVPTVRVTFNQAVRDNSALRCTDAYHLARSDNGQAIAVYAVTPEDAADPTYVDLTTDELVDDFDHYNVTIDMIESAG